MFCGLGILCLAMIVGTGTSQDAKKDKDKAGKIKGQLPPGFKDLGLSTEQVTKIYGIQADYNAKIAELNKQIAELKGKRSKEEFNVLTKDQLEKYLKNKGLDKDKAGKDKDKPAGETKPDVKK
jgi:hypothetical protein